MTNEEKERTITSALRKIHAEQQEDIKMKKPRRFSRKAVILAAAVSLVLAFGVVAYATELFQLGKVGTGDEAYVTQAIDGSDQFKALQEMQKFWEKEWAKLDENDENAHVPQEAIDKETARLMDKYNLIEEGKSHDVKSAADAFSKAGRQNVLGANASIFETKDSLGFYTDAGRVSVMGSDDKGVHYEINCQPNNVAYFYSSWYDGNPGSKIIDEWDMVTAEGLPVKTQIVEEKDAKLILEDGTETTYRAITYKSILFTKDYTISMYVDGADDDDPYDKSREKYEKFINGFEFSKL